MWRGVEGCGGVWRGVEGVKGCVGGWRGCGGLWRGVEGCGGGCVGGWRGCGGCGGVCGGVWRGVWGGGGVVEGCGGGVEAWKQKLQGSANCHFAGAYLPLPCCRLSAPVAPATISLSLSALTRAHAPHPMPHRASLSPPLICPLSPTNLHRVQREGRLPVLQDGLPREVEHVVEHRRGALRRRQRQAAQAVAVGPLGEAGVRVGPVGAARPPRLPLGEQQVVHPHVVVEDGHVHRGVPLEPVRLRQVRPRVQQQPHEVALVRAHREVQRRLAVVGLGPGAEELPGGAVVQELRAGTHKEAHHRLAALDDGDVEETLERHGARAGAFGGGPLVQLKGRGLRGGCGSGWTGGWRRLPKRLGAVTVGYRCC